MNIITIEFHEQDAFRLLWLVQREAAEGEIWDRYWETLADHIRENIMMDLEYLAQIEYQEALARNGKKPVGAVKQLAG